MKYTREIIRCPDSVYYSQERWNLVDGKGLLICSFKLMDRVKLLVNGHLIKGIVYGIHFDVYGIKISITNKLESYQKTSLYLIKDIESMEVIE